MSSRRSCFSIGLLVCGLNACLVVPVMLAQATALPEAPQAPTLRAREVAPPNQVVMVNHRPYMPPTQSDLRRDYLRDTYGPWGIASTTIRASYGQARGKPEGWGQDLPGFGQRFGSAAAVTAIDGSVRYGMEELFHEDLRYIPCHGCSLKHKIENALLAEITARHQSDGHRVFSLTPTVADFSGPIIVHEAWYPGSSQGPLSGVVSARVVFATRVGVHIFREFVLERRHKDEPEGF